MNFSKLLVEYCLHCFKHMPQNIIIPSEHPANTNIREAVYAILGEQSARKIQLDGATVEFRRAGDMLYVVQETAGMDDLWQGTRSGWSHINIASKKSTIVSVRRALSDVVQESIRTISVRSN